MMPFSARSEMVGEERAEKGILSVSQSKLATQGGGGTIQDALIPGSSFNMK